MKKIFHPVDKRNRQQMIDFLTKHPRYYTMNSWNGSTSYANNLKIYKLGLPKEIEDKLYELINIDGFYDSINDLIDDFAEEHDYAWQAGFNGRSGGYLVLYSGGKKVSEYKSRCTICGQLNYKLAPPENPSVEEQIKIIIDNKPWIDEISLQYCKENIKDINLSDDEILKIIRERKRSAKTEGEYSLNNKCGRCGEMTRENLKAPIYESILYPGRGIDQNEDFSEWDMASLRDRVEIVQSFDKLCDDIVEMAVSIAQEYEIEEQKIMVPKTVKVLVKK